MLFLSKSGRDQPKGMTIKSICEIVKIFTPTDEWVVSLIESGYAQSNLKTKLLEKEQTKGIIRLTTVDVDAILYLFKLWAEDKLKLNQREMDIIVDVFRMRNKGKIRLPREEVEKIINTFKEKDEWSNFLEKKGYKRNSIKTMFSNLRNNLQRLPYFAGRYHGIDPLIPLYFQTPTEELFQKIFKKKKSPEELYKLINNQPYELPKVSSSYKYFKERNKKAPKTHI